MTLHLSSAGNLPFRQQRHTHTQGNVILWDTTGVWGALGDCVHMHVKNCKDKCFCAYAANNLNSTVSLPLNARQRFPHQAPHCGKKKKITAAHFSHYITAHSCMSRVAGGHVSRNLHTYIIHLHCRAQSPHGRPCLLRGLQFTATAYRCSWLGIKCRLLWACRCPLSRQILSYNYLRRCELGSPG